MAGFIKQQRHGDEAQRKKSGNIQRRKRFDKVI